MPLFLSVLQKMEEEDAAPADSTDDNGELQHYSFYANTMLTQETLLLSGSNYERKHFLSSSQ